MLVTDSQLRNMTLPSDVVETDTFKPLTHAQALDAVETAISNAGYTIADRSRRTYTVVDKGARMAATLPLDCAIDDESRIMLGIVNSWNKQVSLRIGIGSQVFVCTNGCFFAEKVVGRKHTPTILDDLPRLAALAIDDLESFRVSQGRFFQSLRDVELTDKDTYHLTGRMAREAGVITPGEIINVLDEWHKPSHEEFAPRTAWSLHNAVTEVSKRIENRNGAKFIERTQLLSSFLSRTLKLSDVDAEQNAALVN